MQTPVPINKLGTLSLLVAALLACGPVAAEDDDDTDTRPGIAPDLRDDDTNLKVQKGNFVVVPIPISDPTLGDGLIAGGAYFYPQTEEQEKKQPASMTAAAAMYTNNDSRVLGLAQQNYWKGNKWRFTGAIGDADLRLSLLAIDDTSTEFNLDWRIQGQFLYAKLARKLGGNWYGGAFTRMIDASQAIESSLGGSSFDAGAEVSGYDVGSEIFSIGLGFLIEHDTRDNPYNSTDGGYFKLDTLFNGESIGSDLSYQSYSATYNSYHRLTDSLVLAWQVRGCKRDGKTPLWDACTVKLRGFPATDYLGRSSALGQVEARWQLTERWGLVGFGGTGRIDNLFNSQNKSAKSVPSYGAGLRITVLKAKRINLRIDVARSNDSEAVHISVGEAF